MAAVGIGGFFFRADDPEALRDWYRTRLGVGVEDAWEWRQQAGPTVFLPVARDGDGVPDGAPWMLNLRVDDLDGLVARLRSAGVEVRTEPGWDSPGTGRFARVRDPEGNPVELWEPPREG